MCKQNRDFADGDAAQLAGSKRKSVDVAPESAKKQKTTTSNIANSDLERQTAAASVASVPKDVCEVLLPGQWSDNVPVHESCDQVSIRDLSVLRRWSSFGIVLALSQINIALRLTLGLKVRRRIESHLLQPGVTKAQFCRNLTGQLFSESGPAKIQSNMLDAFLKKRGATSGCTSSVYYAGYVNR